MARLGDVAHISQGDLANKSEKVWLLNLDMVESNTGNIIDYQYVDLNDVGTSTCRFDTTNVLYSKLRPYLNKVVLPEKSGFATSEMLPLKPNPKLLDRHYLAEFLRSQQFVAHISNKVAGAKMPRVNTKDLLDSIIRLPDLKEQQMIAGVFQKVTVLISLRKQQLSKLDELVKSRFIEMFGDLGNNPMQWDLVRLVDTCASSDEIKCGPFGTQLSKDEYQNPGIALWGIPQINSGFELLPTDYLSEEKATQLAAYSLQPGDIAMSRKGNVGKCALFPEHLQAGIIHSDVLRIRANKNVVNPVFLMSQLHYSPVVETQIGLVSNGAIMAGINVTKLKNISVHLPPLPLQNQFAYFVQQVDKSKSEIKLGLEKLELLKNALMQKYFG